MRLCSLTEVVAGTKLAQPIFGASGQVLLQPGVGLTNEYLQSLHEMKLSAIYIDDADTSDIQAPQPISPEVRAKVTHHLARTFDSISTRSDALRDSYVAVAKKDMKAQRFASAVQAAIGGEGLLQMSQDITAMLDELRSRDVLAGLNSIKSHDCYTFQHSIDVTIMGLVLARSLGWDRQRLHAFGVGCILHDIGKIFIDPAILNKPGKLTSEEFTQIQAHPGVGYDLIKELAPGLGVLVPHVAYQHHERQDGTGYPRKLIGTNTLGENRPNTIHDFGALCAVADVYDAMTSDRPYRKGWPPDRTLAMMRENAGKHLNQQAFNIMRSVVPPYPVCCEVRVCTGKYAGWTGIVSSVPKQALDRPKVRLLHDASGFRVDPVEINLLQDPDTRIESATEMPAARAA